MERSFFLKKRRADFVAGSLSGRVIVAGGLGKERASRLWPGAPWTLDVHAQKRVLAPGTPPAYHLIPRHSLLPASTSCLRGWASDVVSLSSYTGETEAQRA